MNNKQENLSSQEFLQENSISARLEEERTRLRWNKSKTALIAQVSGTTVTNWEKGNGYPDAACLARMAREGMDVMYLLSGKRGQTVETPTAEYRSDPGVSRPAAPPIDYQHDALRAALLNTITSSRKHGHKLNTDQFIRVVVGIYFEYLKELQAGSAEILSADETASPGQTGTHG